MQNKIIQFLKKAEGYISGEEISRNVKISRAGVWKNIQELRSDGYDIVAVPHLGYRLLSIPDKLFAREIQYGLKSKVLGRDIVYYDAVESTMDEAFQLGISNAKEGTVVCSESQNKGRGRMGRSWASPKGKGVYFSILLRPKQSPSDVAKLTLLSAIAVCEAIDNVCGIKPSIKWPNDILIDNKKLAGILTELSAEMDRVRFVVIGIGINVNTPMSALPPRATSLKNELGRSVSRIHLIQEVLICMEKWYDKLKEKGFDVVIQRWKELSFTLGKRIKVVDSDGKVEGKAVDIDENGGLIIIDDSGVRIRKMSGDVIQD